MKKLILISLILISFQSVAQMDNLSNLSAEWMRTGARNAATNGLDIVVYNPAGLTKMDDGLHINFSNQSLFRSPSHAYDLGLGDGEKNFKQKGADPFLPELFLAYNKGKFSYFGSAYFSGGGATMNYPEGSLTTDLIALQAIMSTAGAYMNSTGHSLKASSMYLTFTGGVAYEVSNNMSFSIAFRNVNATNKAEGGLTLTASPIDLPDQPLVIKYDENANGIGIGLGFNISCNEKLNIAGRYESRVKLDFETIQHTDDIGLTTDGEMNRRDLPAVAGLGISFKHSTSIRTYFDFNYYFQKQSDWGTTAVATGEITLSSLAGDAYGIGAGIEYSLTEKFTASAGGGFSNYLYSDKEGYYTHLGTFEVMHDDNLNINTGFSYQANQKLKVNVGYMHTFWPGDKNVKALMAQPLDVDVTVNNSLNAFALGFDLSF